MWMAGIQIAASDFQVRMDNEVDEVSSYNEFLDRAIVDANLDQENEKESGINNAIIARKRSEELAAYHEKRIREKLERILNKVVGVGGYIVEVTVEMSLYNSSVKHLTPKILWKNSGEHVKQAAFFPLVNSVSAPNELVVEEKGEHVFEISRLSVSILLDNYLVWDKTEAIEVAVRWKKWELEQLEAALSSAIGLSLGRGDKLTVMNRAFVEQDVTKLSLNEWSYLFWRELLFIGFLCTVIFLISREKSKITKA